MIKDIGRVMAQPRWFLLALAIAVLVPTAVRLGFWQLDRLDQRLEGNAVWQHRLDADPVPLALALSSEAGLDKEALRYLRVTAEGVLDANRQVIGINRPLDGRSGHWVITAMETVDGATIAVVRGWVPFGVSVPDDPRIEAPAGALTVGGILVPGEAARATLAPPTETLERVTNLDLDLLGEAWGVDLGPVYLLQTSEAPEPIEALPLPDVEDRGPHFFYAIQWFSFAIIGAVGFGALVRREITTGRKQDDVQVDS